MGFLMKSTGTLRGWPVGALSLLKLWAFLSLEPSEALSPLKPQAL
jgi:hypothetical protein